MAVKHIDLIKKIQNIMKEIREATPKKEDVSWVTPADLVCREDYLYDNKVNAASMTLFPTGCEFALSGGCTMCGEWSGSNLGELVPGQFHVAQFASGSAQLLHDNNIEWLRIYQEGSFLNQNEVDPHAQETILRLATNLSNIKRVTIETRPEYLTDDVASKIREFTKNAELEIGIGLESKSDFVRNVCVAKGTTLKVFERAVRIAHKNDIIPLAYVILKPPFLTEGEAIRDVIESTKYAFDIGFDEVYIQAASIHEWSLSEMLGAQGLYAPPWLWSMIEVVNETAHLGKVKIGGLEYFPRPSYVSQNYKNIEKRTPCECSHGIWERFQTFNAYGDIGVFADANCDCKNTWKESLDPPVMALPERVEKMLDSVSVQEYFANKGS